jgi:hypothetical protein
LFQKSDEVEKVGIEGFHRREFGKSRPSLKDARRVCRLPMDWALTGGFARGAS